MPETATPRLGVAVYHCKLMNLLQQAAPAPVLGTRLRLAEGPVVTVAAGATTFGYLIAALFS